MCHLLSVTVVREDEYSVPMFQKCSFSQGCLAVHDSSGMKKLPFDY